MYITETAKTALQARSTLQPVVAQRLTVVHRQNVKRSSQEFINSLLKSAPLADAKGVLLLI